MLFIVKLPLQEGAALCIPNLFFFFSGTYRQRPSLLENIIMILQRHRKYLSTLILIGKNIGQTKEKPHMKSWLVSIPGV